MSVTTGLHTTSAIAGVSRDVAKFVATLPDAKTIKASADKAFADNQTGNALLGSAVQRMAYAVMCEQELMVKSGQSNMGLADCLTVPDTKSTITARMMDAFLGAKPDTSEVDGDKTAAIDAAYAKRRQLLNRGVELGAILSSRSISFGYFNTKLGCFAVWPNMLHPADTTPLGRLATEQVIMLDGRGFAYNAKLKNGSEKPRGASASVTQLLSCCKPTAKPRAGKNADNSSSKVTSGATFNLRKIADVAQHIDLPILIGAVHRIMVTDAPAEPMTKDALPASVWSALSAIMQAFDKARNAPTWDTAVTVKTKRSKAA